MKFNTISIPKDVVILIFLSLALNILRVVFFGSFSLLYILWNIFLAMLPLFISSAMLSYSKEEKLNNIMFILLGVLWLLLIPNSPYIVTDLIHIVKTKGVPIIYDTFLIFTAAQAGLVLGFYSFLQIEKILSIKLVHSSVNKVMVLFFLIISFGIYLGRFLRFNSWDVLYSPAILYGGVRDVFSQTSGFKEALIFTILSTVFLSAFYYSWRLSKER